MNTQVYNEVFKFNRRLAIIIAFLVASLLSYCYFVGMFDRVEQFTLDQRFAVRNYISRPLPGYVTLLKKAATKLLVDDKFLHENPLPEGIVFIDVTEEGVKSLSGMPRDWSSAIVKILSHYDARAIVFDDTFSIQQDQAGDIALADAMKASGKVYMPVLCTLNPEKLAYLHMGDGAVSIREPLPIFRGALKGTGHINAITDWDSRLRRVPALINYRGDTYYQYGLRIGFDMLGLKDQHITFYPERHSISLALPGDKTISIPLDANNELALTWRKPQGSDFPHYAFADVVQSVQALQEGRRPLLDLTVFKNKICIIDVGDSGVIDPKPMVVMGGRAPAGVTALVIQSVLGEDFLRTVPVPANILIIFFTSFLFTISLTNLRLLRAMMVMIVGVTFYIALSLFGMPNNANMILFFIGLIGVAILLTSFRLLTGLIFTVISCAFYLAVSLTALCTFNLVIVTFYPVLAIITAYLIIFVYAKVAQYVDKIHLIRQATRDGLTGLYNRRHFNLLLDSEMKNAALHKQRKISLIMCDIDNFKKLNDTYGHQAGDLILKEFSKIMQAQCRQADVVGRYGGEEFIIMLTGAGGREACAVAEKIRAAIAAKSFTFKGQLYSTSLSMGVAEYRGEKLKEELIEKADKALYKAKQTGKNKWVMYE